MKKSLLHFMDCMEERQFLAKVFQSLSLVLFKVWHVVLSGRRQLSISTLGLLSILRRNFPESCTLSAVMDFHFLDVKESYVAIKIFRNSGIFYFAVCKHYTKEISCFQSVSSFYSSLRCFGRLLLCFLFIFPQILLCCLVIIFYLTHGCVAEAFQNYYSTPPLLGNKCVLVYVLGNLSSADVTGTAILSLMETV